MNKVFLLLILFQIGSGSCLGDSGGPVTMNVNGAHFLLGVVSWGYDCTKGQYPDVYQFVPKFVDWTHKKRS